MKSALVVLSWPAGSPSHRILRRELQYGTVESLSDTDARQVKNALGAWPLPGVTFYLQATDRTQSRTYKESCARPPVLIFDGPGLELTHEASDRSQYIITLSI